MFELKNVFDAFIPKLLLHPNPLSYLNMEAANMLLKNPKDYKRQVKDMVQKYAATDDICDVSSEIT